MQEWINANGWFSVYMIFSSLIVVMVAISSANGEGLLGFYRKDATLFGKFVIILFLIALLPAIFYVSAVGLFVAGFFKAVTKSR